MKILETKLLKIYRKNENKGIFILLLLVINQFVLANETIRNNLMKSEPLFTSNRRIWYWCICYLIKFDLKLNQVFIPYHFFIGYQTLQISDKSRGCSNKPRYNTLEIFSCCFDVVTVTSEAIKNTETALLTIKKKSVNVIDGISSQNFKKMGDGNAAAAVVRIPGVSLQGGKYVYVRGLGDRYTKTTFNGLDIPGLDPDRNSLQMDIFPTNIVDNIIVSKSFTADLPADFTGGVIDINIKSFPEIMTLKGSSSISYNKKVNLNGDFLTYYGGETDYLAHDDGSRDFPLANKILDVQTVQDPRINPETMPNTLLFNPQMATERGKDYFSNNKFFKLYNSITNNSTMNFNGGSLSLSGGNQITIQDKTIGYSGAFSYKNKFSFYKDQIQNSFEKSSDPLDYDLFVSKKQQGDVGKSSALLSAMAEMQSDP